MIAVSTAWNAARHAGWEPAVREVLGLGFPHVALDGPALAPDAAAAGRAVREARGTLAALFAPAPVRDAASPVDGGGLVDARAERREAAVALALAAGRAAIAAGTPLVVVRPGSIPVLDASREDRWTERLGREGATPELRAEVAAAAEALRPDRARALDALCRSVWSLARALPDAVWAVELPSGVAGVPFPGEIETLLGEVRGRRVGVWHDAAHAARLGALGAADPCEWIARAGGAVLGVTVSDWSAPVLGGAGGRTPVGAGIVDWAALRSQLGTSAVRVLRLGPDFPAGLLAESVREARSRGL